MKSKQTKFDRERFMSIWRKHQEEHDRSVQVITGGDPRLKECPRCFAEFEELESGCPRCRISFVD